MTTLPLPIVKEISFEELTTLLPADCRIHLCVNRPPVAVTTMAARQVEPKLKHREHYTLIA